MNNNIYIMSIEAAEIYEHMYRDKELYKNYIGMLPYSLKQMHLEKIGLKTFDSKRYNKIMTNDVINIKFKQKVRSAEEIIKLIDKKILGLSSDEEEYGEKLIAYRDLIIRDKDKNIKKWVEVKNDNLRTILYKDGFTIKNLDKDTGKITEIKYVVLARSSAKSRTGQVLFIKEKLKDKIIKWMRMGMNLEGRNDIDYPSLLSYESLIGSSIEDFIKIDSKNILLVSDVKSIFNIDCNVVKKNEKGLLESVAVKDYKMESDIFDGEGVLDVSVFAEANRQDKGFMLLREHMFKCCAFNTNIQLFLQDYAKTHEIDFNTWQVKNIFDEPMLAKDILFVITPASLKALKFSNVKGSKRKMWEHWKKKINEEGNIFGICKSDKESKRGFDDKGNILNQTSYQYLNSMPYIYKDMEELSEYEVNYIEQLKNNDDVYIQYLKNEANRMNCNEMLVDLYNRNSKIVNSKVFKDKRKKDIHNYKKHIKKGKVRLPGDYCTIIQNGRELLYHVIGKLPVNKNGVLDYEAWENEMILKDNEVYTKLHKFYEEYVAFRSPHTAPSNVFICYNKDNEFIRNYFNLTDNVVYTNAINFPVNRILSGQDVDSDQIVIFNHLKMLEIARQCYIMSEYSNYKVCENGVSKKQNEYTVCDTDMAKIDNILANSQKYIGTVVNLGQLYMSTYWDYLNNGETDKEKLNTLLQGIDVCTILSEISIDMAKRLYDIDIKKQIDNLRKCKYLYDKKPNFFKYVSKNKKISSKIQGYKTAMDYLYNIVDAVGDAEGKDTVWLEKFLIKRDMTKVKTRQVNGIINYIVDMTKEIKGIEAKYEDETEDDKNEKYNAIDDVKSDYMQKIKHYKIKIETIYAIIYKVFNGQIKCKYKIDLLNVLYRTNKEVFLEAFKAKK